MNALTNLKRFYWLVRSPPKHRIIRKRVVTQLRNFTAYLWRRLLFRTTFIAISGSVGKTTTKEFLAEVLGKRYSTVRTPGNWNLRKTGGLEATILRARPWHRYVVVEIGIEKPGDMASAARFLKPDIAVILSVKRCHTNTFKTLDAIAHEKSILVHSLGARGHAIVNQDDPRVVGMASSLNCRVTRFGTSENADVRLRYAKSRWPDRLTLNIEDESGLSHQCSTKLVGTHWAPSILATLVTAKVCGIPLKEGIGTINAVEPIWARMQPITLPAYGGATVVREDWNGSIDTFETAFEMFGEAEARRKIVVFSDYSDSSQKSRVRANFLGRQASRLADIGVFVGDYAERSVGMAVSEGMAAERAHAFISTASATKFLKTVLRRGDLVLIKGRASHHLSRIYLGLIGDVACTLPSCSQQILCDYCPQLGFEWTPTLQGYMARRGESV